MYDQAGIELKGNDQVLDGALACVADLLSAETLFAHTAFYTLNGFWDLYFAIYGSLNDRWHVLVFNYNV